MSIAKSPLGIVLLISLVAVPVVGGCASSGAQAPAVQAGLPGLPDPITAATLGDRIEQARTPADHEQVAAYYEAQAAAAAGMAEECRRVRQRYENRPQRLVYAFAVPGATRHYGHLIESYDQAAEQYNALAQAHRAAADQARAGH